MPPPARPRRLLAGAAAVPLLGAVLGVLIVVGAAPASAHAVLDSTTPASGSTVPAPPSGVTLTFDEAVRAPAYIVVTGPGGVRVDEGKARVRGAVVTTGLRKSVPAGRYTVAFRVVSDDGHPVEDQFTYAVTATAASPSTAAQSPAVPTPPSAAAPAPTSVAAAAAVGGDGGLHLVHVLGGLAVVLAGAGALVYERFQRRRHHEDAVASR